MIIVGATGYIGKRLYGRLMADGARGTSSKSSEEMLLLRLDMPDDFDYGVIKKGDAIFVTAAVSAPDVCANQPEYAEAVNVTGTITFISNVINCGAHVIFFSSDTIYGECKEKIDENVDCNPAGDYAVMKNEVERHFFSNPSFKAVRLSYVFSKEDKFTNYLIGCEDEHRTAEIFHPFYRAVIHRDDVIDGVIALANRWDEFMQPVINFGGPELLARTHFAETLKKVALPMLDIKITEPDESFFDNRPRVINMTSPLLEALLGRPVRTLREAAEFEFLNRNIHD